ncbi:two-partner secretion domain-containing protein, partial [Dickeya lacustris]
MNQGSGTKTVAVWQRALVWGLVWLTGMQPVLSARAAGVTVATGPTTVDVAGNGVPVVNIAAPDATGLSHNRYQSFSVDGRGLILNNGTAALTATQLGGLIQNNPNLVAGGRPAGAILNEVVSPTRSELSGYLEVAGPAASVVVANPYGITCNGCGFINTPRITLTTGVPQVNAAGGLSGLDVRGGDILVTGAGLDASRSDYFALIAHTASLQAGLNAGGEAQVVLGTNRVGADGEVSAQASPAGGPSLALDTGALGGMYANRIRLVSTGQGVGVNTSGLGARQGDITLTADGHLQVGTAVAQGALTAQGRTLTLTGQQQAEGDIRLRGGQGVALTTSGVRAGGGLTVESGGAVTATAAQLSAGVTAAGQVMPGYGVTLSGASLGLGQSHLSGDRLSLRSDGGVSQASGGAWRADSGLTVSGGALSLDGEAGAQSLSLSGTTLDGRGRWQASGALTAQGFTQAGWDGELLAGGPLTVTAQSLENRGTLAGGELRLTTPALTNRGTVSGRQVTVQAGRLQNGGTLAADTSLTVTADGVENGGQLLAGGALTVSGGAVSNRGTVSGGTVTVSGSSLESQGTVQGREQVQLTVTGALNQGASGRLSSGGLLQVSGGSLSDAGTTQARRMALTTGVWQHSGSLSVTEDGRLAVTSLFNDGAVFAGGPLSLTGDYQGAGLLTSDAALSLT